MSILLRCQLDLLDLLDPLFEAGSVFLAQNLAIPALELNHLG